MALQKKTSAVQRPNGIRNWNLLMSFRILFTSKIKLLNTIDLHYHQRLNFRKLICYLSEDVLQQREPNLTSYKRLTKKKKKKKKKNQARLPRDQIEWTNLTDWSKLTNQRTKIPIWLWQPLQCKTDQSLLQTKFATFELQKIVQSTLMTSAQASL